MVAIKKRRTSETVLEDIFGESWRMVFRLPVLYPFINDKYGLWNQDTSADHLLDVSAKCKRGSLTNTPLQEKVFMYILCFFMWRVFGKSLLTDHEYSALYRHLSSSAILPKIDAIGNIPNLHRSIFVFDLPVYWRTYRRANSMSLPVPVNAASTKKNKLRRPKPKK